MNSPQPVSRPATSHRRAQLLWGASLATLIAAAAGSGARAQSLGALYAASHQAAAITSAIISPGVAPTTSSAAMAATSTRALRNQTQVYQTLSFAQQAQSAARTAAAAAASTVPDGLVAGGLQPVAKPVLAAADPTGLNTWQGAAAPTTGSGPDDVVVVQKDPRAVLSWTTFNVGQHTSLTFKQQQNGVDQASWVVLNRVVGQLDPTTDLRLASTAPSPSQFLGTTIQGKITAPGTVLIIDQNGILFSGTAQVNVGSLAASSLEIGHALEGLNATAHALNIAQRDSEFLSFGLLGYAAQNANLGPSRAATFSAQSTGNTLLGPSYDPVTEGSVRVASGASLTSADGGYLMLLAPNVVNSGQLTSPDGEVALQSGRFIQASASTGDANSADPDVRGLVVVGSTAQSTDAPDSVVNATGIIQSPRGYISLGATGFGSVQNLGGAITATTSVSRNGYINLSGGRIDLKDSTTTDGAVIHALIAITPDTSAAAIPQDHASLSAFKTSRVRIGDLAASAITIGQNSLIYAPGANISIGADPGATSLLDKTNALTNIFVDDGATIDAAGLTGSILDFTTGKVIDLSIPASRNAIKIDPVKGNELANSPAFRKGTAQGFLDGQTVYLDPRLSGVNANGVAWVGSPLISAVAYAQQVGVTAAELLTKGGNVTLGTATYSPSVTGVVTTPIPGVIIKSGANIDIAGGWKTYQAGNVQQSYLIDANGQVVPISQANPDSSYIGLYGGYVASQPRWGINRVYVDPLLTGTHFEGQYSDGADAGSLTIKSSAAVLDGSVFAAAYTGPEQIVGATPGTGSASAQIYGDLRKLQGAPSQLPSGGFLNIQAQVYDPIAEIQSGGGDISIVAAKDYSQITGSTAPKARLETLTLNANALSGAGLSQLTVQTTGKIDVAADAKITLAAGGEFKGLAGGALTVEGTITAPSGTIDLSTAQIGGSIFFPQIVQPGTFDISVSGTLNVAGRWANDYNAAAGDIVGSAYLNGGQISLAPAPRAGIASDTIANAATDARKTLIDSSGSILIATGAVLDVSGGGYVNAVGALNLSAKGGNLSLYQDTTYFLIPDPNVTNVTSGFRVASDLGSVVVNPSAITGHISIADGSIRALGFGGGGTFTLTAPSFAFGDSSVTVLGGGSVLPLKFFSEAGFANYNITSYATQLSANTFGNGLGGYNAVLATQKAVIGAGGSLDLTQSAFSPLLTSHQIDELRLDLKTGHSLYEVQDLTRATPADPWDQKPVSLSLGGLIELHVAQGGQIIGAPGSSLTVSQLWNQGTIHLPGGTVTQSEILPTREAQGGLGAQVSNLSSVTEAQAKTTPFYVLGDLGTGEGVRLDSGSVTDLSGEAILNPRATPGGDIVQADFIDGRVIAGGSLISTNVISNGGPLFHAVPPGSGYVTEITTTRGVAETLNAAPGAQINLAGAHAIFDRLGVPGAVTGSGSTISFAPTLIWSDAGALTLNSGGTVTGALIDAHGGAPLAMGGVLTLLNPVVSQNDLTTPTIDTISAAAITNAGFASFVALGRLTSMGDATLSLPRAVFVVAAALPGITDSSVLGIADLYAPVIGSGGVFQINAPYIGLISPFQTVSNPDPRKLGGPGAASVLLSANAIDVSGAVVFDPSVSQATLSATGAIRLTGVGPLVAGANGVVASTLIGQLAVNGNLTLHASQVYPTTGSTFALTSIGRAGTIAFQAAAATTPAAPYSAGGKLYVLANTIDQAGVLRVPLGGLTLGATTAELRALNLGDASDASTVVPLNSFAQPTTSLTLEPGSTTSVSADGLVIPYGTTTDQKEWFFAPTNTAPLAAPPAGILQLAGDQVSVLSGATVDLKGGGDIYAYEFISGTGGSRDVLSRFNSDQFTSTNGYQYPDQRQVYAIVPGLSAATVAAFDPIYSSQYGASSGAAGLYGPSQVGKQVYLNGATNLAAGWYTLLPAQYALLPGGMRVVQDTGAATPPPIGGVVKPDGTIVTSGYFGFTGVNSRDAQLSVFDVATHGDANSQIGFLAQSKIAVTSGAANFAALAAKSGSVVPQLPIDAGRLILNPISALSLNGAFQTAAATGGRGSQVDISGASLTIDHAGATVGSTGTIVLTDASLANLNASSLLLGGVRTDNADGTTSLLVSTNTITVAAGTNLIAPEIILATNGDATSPGQITIADTAGLTAAGTLTNPATGAYVIDGMVTTRDSQNNPIITQVQSAQGGFVRVANGPQRQVTRLDADPTVRAGAIAVGKTILSGAAVEVTTPGALSISDSVMLTAPNLTLGAGQIAFGAVNPDPTGAALLITPTLQAAIAKSRALNLQSGGPLLFDSGAYTFGDLTIDAPTLGEAAIGGVTLNTGKLTLANRGGGQGSCGQIGVMACGKDFLTVNASQIAFSSGDFALAGFGGGVTFNAPNGVFIDGAATFDAGASIFTLNTPFLGDRGSSLAGAVPPSLTLASTVSLTTTNVTQGPGSGVVGTVLSQSTSTNGRVTTDVFTTTSTTATRPKFPSVAVTTTTTTVATADDITIANTLPTAFVKPPGTPGSALTITGNVVTINGSDVRTTAGTLAIKSFAATNVGDAAQIDPTTGAAIVTAAGNPLVNSTILEAPAYFKTFGDSADPQNVWAPAGALSLTSIGGDIALSAGSRLSLGYSGTIPNGLTLASAGTLSLRAQNGSIYVSGPVKDSTDLGSVLATGGLGGASLTLDSGNAGFNLSAFAEGVGKMFNGAISIRTGANSTAPLNLTLNSGDSLTADSVSLTADGGFVQDSGAINASGVNGGTVSLYGARGVILTSTAVIEARATGYESTSTPTLQANGGKVTLGVDGTGTITVAQGAVIDVAAINTTDRLVAMNRTNGVYDTAVAGDIGGMVTFRAPVVAAAGGGQTVNVNVSGAVNGASATVLEAFQQFDLSTFGVNPMTKLPFIDPVTKLPYQGVTIVNNVATIDLGAMSVGSVNALGYSFDGAGNIINGPVVNFIQTFDKTVIVPNRLSALANFHARPGISLFYNGDIVLNSNWNLGAGVVNTAAAVTAGLMVENPVLEVAGGPKVYSVVPGQEGQLLSRTYLDPKTNTQVPITQATYRVGATFYGEPGVLTLRAGGSLDLKYSITDGFFQFRDQTNPGYLNYAVGGGNRIYQASFTPTCNLSNCQSIFQYNAAPTPGNYVSIVFPTAALIGASFTDPAAPYSAIANAPSAQGSRPIGGGDPLGSAELFPLLPSGETLQPVGSWSYQLVGGAMLPGAAGSQSANPMTVAVASAGAVTVEGQHTYSYGSNLGATGFASNLNLVDFNNVSRSVSDWLSSVTSPNGSDLSANAYTQIDYTMAPQSARPVLDGLVNTFFHKLHPDYAVQILYRPNSKATPSGVIDAPLSVAAAFMQYVSDHFGTDGANTIGQAYAAHTFPKETAIKTVYAAAPTLVRSGTGAISIVAAGSIDLQNGSTPQILNASGVLVTATDVQLGGTAIYTAGHLAIPVSNNIFLTNPQTAYTYGGVSGGISTSSFAGILIANSVYADGGGDITLNAGVDVLSRRNTFQEKRLGALFGGTPLSAVQHWIGSGDQPWRVGSIGQTVNATIDPQLFDEGVGTLGGGDISVSAGRDVADLSVVATDSLATTTAGGATILTKFGGGDISISAGRDILGGRLDVAAGQATLVAQGALATAGVLFPLGPNGIRFDNSLRVRLRDGAVNILAGGPVALQGIGALGITTSAANYNIFYATGASVSIVTDGAVNVANSASELLTHSLPDAGATISAIYPGSFSAISLTGSLNVSTSSTPVLLTPDPKGTLTLLAGGDIAAATIAQLDSDPSLLPGAFTSFSGDQTGIFSGAALAFPAVLSSTNDVVLRLQHNAKTTHVGDVTPNRIVAGGDIGGALTGAILSMAKQTRITAGRDIVNMVFLGQNVAAGDVTRITAGRDINATTKLESPLTALGPPETFGASLPTVQGDTFVLGGPGALLVEAGRDAGPFLNSATITNGFSNVGTPVASGVLTYGGGVITVGNLRNPFLAAQSADIYIEFGVAKGQNFQGLIDAYLNPAAILDPVKAASLPAYAFLQTTDVNGALVPDRSKPVYGLSLVNWITSIAADIVTRYDTSAGVTAPGQNAPALVLYAQGLKGGKATSFTEALSYLPQLADRKMPLIPWLLLNESDNLTAIYGTTNINYQQAYDTFTALPQLDQRQFLIKDVYFNELIQTSVPDSGSYLKYSRGYLAVNTLFPGGYGYTQNSVSGGSLGSTAPARTGDLDLRLATVQTDQGGDIVVLGPGGRVLAGSTVATSTQAARRNYDGGRLFAGGLPSSPIVATTFAIPVAYEGFLTLGGGGIDAFTDGDFLLNQSRAFTEAGGDIAAWSSNGGVNAGQGARTTASVPPVLVRVDENGHSTPNDSGAVSGAGIGAFQPDHAAQAPNVYLIAPTGTVDAGDAGVRSAGNVFIAALQVANANAIQAQGAVSGDQSAAAVNVGAQSSGDAASAAASQAAQVVAGAGSKATERPLIIVDVLGFLADESDNCSEEDRKRGKCY